MKTTLSLAMITASIGTAAMAQSVEISRSGERAGMIGPTETFVGTVYVEPLFDANEHRRFSAGEVTFLPGARSNWHTHPHGQTLMITKGTGWTQERGQARQEIKAGDVVWCPPGVEHWHGATATTSVSHIALQELDNGSAVAWGEAVSDGDYGI